MNILLTTETYLPYITGVSVSTDNIARFMLSQGHKVTLICPKPLVDKKAEYPEGLKLIFIPSFPFTFYNNNAIAVFPLVRGTIENEIKNTKFDVVHIQEPGVIGLSALSLARKYKIPTIGSLHFIPEQVDRVLWGSLENLIAPLINLFIHTVYNKYDQIMTVSNFFADFLKSVGITRPINIISNGVDTNLFKPQELDSETRQKYGFEKTDVVFFFLGRLDRDKNVETLVRAMPGTKNNIKLVIVGRGTESKFLQNLSRKLTVEDKIKWISYVTDAEMLKLYSAVDAFCIMSPYEGQSIVTLQAAASGLPIIAANAGALPELVTEGVNGYLIKTYDYKTLAERMNSLASSNELRQKFGLESRKVSLKHERSLALRKLESIYIILKRHAQG
jgi:glycosyltransferase involved in cell wall biosynthesis